MSLYKVLNISVDADINEIRTAYRRAALRTHPDKGGSEECFKLVTVAFETLSNTASREAYDKVNGHFHRSLARSLTIGIKRARSASAALNPEPKRCLVAIEPHRRACKRCRSQKYSALEKLRSVLQAMDGAGRRKAMQTVDQRIQKALLAYMEEFKSPHTKSDPKLDGEKQCQNLLQPSKLLNSQRLGITEGLRSGITGVHKLGHLYRASLSAANLELYCRLQPKIEVSIEHHIILTQIRSAILSTFRRRILHTAKHALICDEVILRVCEQILGKSNTSEEELQLRAKVRVRASQWLGSIRLSSPVLPLQQALRLRARLLRARQTSWQAFREECIPLLQQDRRCYGKSWQLSFMEASHILDRAWANATPKRQALELQQDMLLARALRRVTFVLDVEERGVSRVKARLKSVAIVQGRKIEASRRRVRDEIRRWYRRNDLTMEEIMQGLPVHMRSHMQHEKCKGSTDESKA